MRHIASIFYTDLFLWPIQNETATYFFQWVGSVNHTGSGIHKGKRPPIFFLTGVWMNVSNISSSCNHHRSSYVKNNQILLWLCIIHQIQNSIKFHSTRRPIIIARTIIMHTYDYICLHLSQINYSIIFSCMRTFCQCWQWNQEWYYFYELLHH